MKKLLALFAAAAFFPLPGHTAAVKHKLNVTIGIFDAADIDLSYKIGGGRYNFVSKVKTAGIFGSLYAFSAEYSTSGIAGGSGFSARDYHYISDTSSHQRTKRLVFDNSGKLQHRLSSKDGKRKKVDISLDGRKFDANDLQTVFASLAGQFIDNRFCDMEKTVFDGKKSYTVTFRDEGKTILDDPEVPFTGKAWKCSAYIKPLNAGDGDMLWTTTAGRPVYFWVMEDKKTGLPFLAKAEIGSTPLGRLKAYTTEITAEK